MSSSKSVCLGEPILRILVATGKAGRLVARGTASGFVLLLRDGDQELTLEARRGNVRYFKKLDTLAGYLRDIGAQHFEVELGDWGDQPETN